MSCAAFVSCSDFMGGDFTHGVLASFWADIMEFIDFMGCGDVVGCGDLITRIGSDLMACGNVFLPHVDMLACLHKRCS